MSKTPRFNLIEAQKHFWAGPRALVDAIDGCGADQLTPDTALWLRRQGVNLLTMQNLFGIPAKKIDEMIRGARAAGGEVADPEPEPCPEDEPEEKHGAQGRRTPDDVRERACKMYADGAKIGAIAKTLSLGWSTVRSIVKPPVPETPAEPKPEAAAEEPVVLEKPTAPLETPVSVVTYRPVVPRGEIARHRHVLEEMHASIDADARTALSDRDYDIASMIIEQLQALSVAIDLASAEIARCRENG